MPFPDAAPDQPPVAHDAAAQPSVAHHHPPAAAPLVADEQQRHITVASGGLFTLQKISSGSIGYSWALADAGDPAVVQLVSTADSQDAPRPPGPPMVGAPSHTVWTFRAVAAGQTHLRFTFAQRTGLGMAVPGPELYTITVR